MEKSVLEKSPLVEKNPYPLEALGRGIENINDGWSFDRAINFIKELDIENTTIRTDQPEEKLHQRADTIDLLGLYLKKIDLDTPESCAYFTDRYEEIKLNNGRIICPTEYILLINLDTKGPQGNPPIKSIEFSTNLTREKTKGTMERLLDKIPTNWQFNPRPR